MNEYYSISSKSKLYRFLNWCSNSIIFGWFVTKDEYKEELKCLDSGCKLLRVLMYILLFSLFILSILGYSSYLLFNYSFSYQDLMNTSINPFLISAIIFIYLFPCLLVCSLLIGYLADAFSASMEYLKDKKEDKPEKEPNVIIQSIKDRHNKICRTFKVKHE